MVPVLPWVLVAVGLKGSWTRLSMQSKPSRNPDDFGRVLQRDMDEEQGVVDVS
jgi:hypothetical protein